MENAMKQESQQQQRQQHALDTSMKSKTFLLDELTESLKDLRSLCPKLEKPGVCLATHESSKPANESTHLGGDSPFQHATSQETLGKAIVCPRWEGRLKELEVKLESLTAGVRPDVVPVQPDILTQLASQHSALLEAWSTQNHRLQHI